MPLSERLVTTKNGRKMMKCKRAECGIIRANFIGGQTGHNLWSRAADAGTEPFLQYGLPYMAKKSVEMGRYYGSEALRNKKLQDKVGNYVIEEGKKYARKAIIAGMEDLRTKIRPKKAYKTNREDLGNPDPYKMFGKQRGKGIEHDLADKLTDTLTDPPKYKKYQQDLPKYAWGQAQIFGYGEHSV